MNDKIKVSVYLSPETKQKLDKIYTELILKGDKRSYGQLVTHAVENYIEVAELMTNFKHRKASDPVWIPLDSKTKK